MNGTTIRNILRCGYSLCSKEIALLQPSTSRILYFNTAERNYWSTHRNQRNTFVLPSIEALQWNVNKSLVAINFRYLSTTLPHYSQAALKPKSPDHGQNNKQKKDNDRKNTGNQVETQSKVDTENDHFTDDKTESIPQVEEKLTLTAKFKRMYKDYWYVLLPVHIFTSTFWFCGFYYLSTSGVDIPSLLESMHFSETVINKLRDSSLGHAAIAYLCYKIATPIRYTVTLGGTTLTIKYLSQWGYIRPVPTRAQIKQIFDDQKAKFKKD